MKKAEWPGIATAVGVILILTMVANLKDFQPLIAAIIALGAGTMAYIAAMAKVNQDREFAERTEDRRKLGLCLQLQLAAENLAETTDEMIRNVENGSHFNLSVSEPTEVLKAWDNLDALPTGAVRPLNTIRWSFSRIQKAVREAEITTEEPVEWKQIKGSISALNDAANDLRGELQMEIVRLRGR